MSKVVAVQFDNDVQASFSRAIKLVKIDDLNRKGRPVVVKVGVFSKSSGVHTSVKVVNALSSVFSKAPMIYLAESDNYSGPAKKRLEIWSKARSNRVAAFSLSGDENVREVKVAGEKLRLSNIVFKPNVFVSTHVPRRIQGGPFGDLFLNKGSVLKNLLGLVPDIEKDRFHEKLPSALLDMYEAIGGIDLAVLDGTYTFLGVEKKKKRLLTNVLLAGRDAISVEAVGAYLVGLDPEQNPVIQEAMKRGLGEGDLNRIEILGDSIENTRGKIIRTFRKLLPKSTDASDGLGT
jgi:uncharacterized protein (DUF362 family)